MQKEQLDFLVSELSRIFSERKTTEKEQLIILAGDELNSLSRSGKGALNDIMNLYQDHYLTLKQIGQLNAKYLANKASGTQGRVVN